jgi:phosphoribosylanthranilate isomerase
VVRVKVCGITNLEDALVAVTAGADALGFNFWPHSARYVDPRKAAAIIAQLPPFVNPVGLFVNEAPSQVNSIARRTAIRAVQLHGDESPEEAKALANSHLAVLKAFRVGRNFKPRLLQQYELLAAFLLDVDVKGQRGGTGKSFDWGRARAARRYGRIFLAGGLTVENVADAIRQAQPYGVDVCTGVEKKPGQKDHQRLREFIRRAKETVTS